jgi:general secretion pathway protein C
MDLRNSERYLMVVNAVLVAAMAYFAALCVDEIIIARLQPAAPPTPFTPPRIAAVETTLPRTAYDRIAKRDIFNLAPPPQVQAPPAPVARDLHVKLLGTSILSVGEPFAIIEDTRTGKQLLFRVGQEIPDTGRLVEVKRSSVIIDQGGGNRVTVTMESTELTPSPRGTNPMMRPHRFRGGRGIRRYGDNHYMLQRAVVDKNLSNLGSLLTQIRAVPNMVGGRPEGYVLSEIQPGSIFQQIGLHDGDILMNINGQEVRDPAQAMQLFATLRNSPSLTLQVMREGAPMQMQYTIH